MPLVLMVGFKQRNAPIMAEVKNVADPVATRPWNRAIARLWNSYRRFAKQHESRYPTFVRRLGSWPSPVVKRVGGTFGHLLKL